MNATFGGNDFIDQRLPAIFAGDIEVTVLGAKIVSEGKLDITQATPNGPVKGEAKGGQEFEVAVDGGYPMKSKSTVEFDGNMNGQSLTIVFRIECEMKK